MQSQQLFVEALQATEKPLEAMLAVQRVHGNNEVQQGTLRRLEGLGLGWGLGVGVGFRGWVGFEVSELRKGLKNEGFLPSATAG